VKTIRPDDDPDEQKGPNTLAMMIRFTVIAAAALLVLAFARYR
jgi:hypothetical protein